MRRPFLLAAALLTACVRPGSTPRAASGPDSLTLVVAGTTDVHGWLRGWDYFANAPDTTRGLARIATIVDSLRVANPDRVVLVDAGDLLQGTPITSVALRDSLGTNPIIAAMNAMHYDAAAIGNHEFNYGMRYLSRALSQARFSFVAANTFTPSGTRAYIPWTMVTRSGVRVAVVGGTTPGSLIWDRDKLAGRATITDIVASVREAALEARAKGADVVIASLHSGLNEPASYDTTTGIASENVAARVAREAPVDLVIFGHTHRELPDTLIGSVLVQQPRNWAGSLSVARLSLARRRGAWTVTARAGGVIRARGHAESADLLKVTDDAHRKAMAFVAESIGFTPVAWRGDSARVLDSPIIDFILDVERRASGADLASVAAFSLNASFGPGKITVAQMAELYPYENNVLRAVRINGRQLREYIEFSARYFRDRTKTGGDSLIDPGIPGFNYDIVAGVDYVLDLTKPMGQRVTSLTRNGTPVADGDSFTMAMHDYRQQGGGGFAMLRGAPVVYDRQEQIRQLLIDEVRRKGVLKPEDYFVRNWRLAPDSVVSSTYRAMRRLPFDRPRATPPGAQ